MGVKRTMGVNWYGYNGIVMFKPTGEAYNYVLERVLSFLNYLLSDIPANAAAYIKDKVPTVEIYLNLAEYNRRTSVKYSINLYDMEKGVKYRGSKTVSGSIDQLWLTSTTNHQYAVNPLEGFGSLGGKTFHHSWGGYVGAPGPIKIIAGKEPGPWGERSSIDFAILKDVLSISLPIPDEEAVTNIPRSLNALMQDIVDVYYVWLQGYGEEWKKRIRTKIIEESIPKLRMQLKPTIYSIASTYAYLPAAAVDVGEMEITTSVLNEVNKRIQEITDYLPIIEKNKDQIVRMFGIEEYNRLIADAQAYRMQLYQKRAEYIKERLQTVDIQYLHSLNLAAMSDVELNALNSCLDSLIANLKQQVASLDSQIQKYQAIIKEAKSL